MGRRPLRAKASWVSLSWTRLRSCHPLRLGLHRAHVIDTTPGTQAYSALKGIVRVIVFVRPHSCHLLRLGLHSTCNISDDCGSKALSAS